MLWRSADVAMGRVARLQEFQRCDAIDHLEDHLNSWEALANEHTKEFLQYLALLRSIVPGLVPHDVEYFIP